MEEEEQEQHEFCHPKKNICMGTRFHTGQRMLKALAESISSLVLLSQHNNGIRSHTPFKAKPGESGLRRKNVFPLFWMKSYCSINCSRKSLNNAMETLKSLDWSVVICQFYLFRNFCWSIRIVEQHGHKRANLVWKFVSQSVNEGLRFHVKSCHFIYRIKELGPAHGAMVVVQWSVG